MIKHIYKRTSWNDLIVSEKRGQLKTSWPKFQDGGVRVCSMGEIGERAVAEALNRVLRGNDENDKLDLHLTFDHWKKNLIPMTTFQLVKEGMLTPVEEKLTQERDGIDIVLIPKAFIDEKRKLDSKTIRLCRHLCVQVKFQPWAPAYNGITIELGKDINCIPGRKYCGQPIEPDGVAKSIAKWTAYIVGGGTILFFETETLRKLAYEHKPKYIGDTKPVWGRPGKYKSNVGSRLTLPTLLNTAGAQPINVSSSFRDYFAQIHDTDSTLDTQHEYSWKLFVQGWSVDTLKTFVGGGITALNENQIRGSKYAY